MKSNEVSKLWKKIRYGELKHLCRPIDRNEIILEYDDEERGKELADEQISKLMDMGLSFKVYDHNGKSPHIHLEFDDLKFIDEDRLSKAKKIITEYLSVDKSIDMSLCAKGKFIAKENEQHWKSYLSDERYKLYGKKILQKEFSNGKNEADAVLSNKLDNLTQESIEVKYPIDFSKNKVDLDLSTIIDTSRLRVEKGKEGTTELRGTHPFHDSKGDNNFHWNVDKEQFYCHRHHFGGDIFDLVSMKHGITECNDNHEKVSADKDKFKAVCEIMKNVYGVQTLETSGDIRRIKMDSSNLVYSMKHLPYANIVKDMIGLVGDDSDLNLYRKASYYQMLSMILNGSIKSYIKENPLMYQGQIVGDLRVNVNYIMPSGFGKSNIKQFLLDIAKVVGISYSASSSLHPEQLIGTSRQTGGKGKAKEWYHVKGELSRDLIIMDEASKIYSEKSEKYTEIRKYLNMGLDAYGKNQISKRLVNCPIPLRYYPTGVFTQFMQDFSFTSDALADGNFRRTLKAYRPLHHKRDEKMLDNELYGKVFNQMYGHRQVLQKYCVWLYHNAENEIRYPQDNIIELINKYAHECNQIAMSRSETAKNVGHNLLWPNKYYITNMAILLAFAEGEIEVKEKHVKLAYTDYVEFYVSALDYAETFMTDSHNYNNNRSVSKIDNKHLKFYNMVHGVISKKDFWNLVNKTNNYKDNNNRTAQRIQKQLIDAGLFKEHSRTELKKVEQKSKYSKKDHSENNSYFSIIDEGHILHPDEKGIGQSTLSVIVEEQGEDNE